MHCKLEGLFLRLTTFSFELFIFEFFFHVFFTIAVETSISDVAWVLYPALICIFDKYLTSLGNT